MVIRFGGLHFKVQIVDFLDFFQWVFQRHTSESVIGTSRLNLGLPSQAIAAYGSAQLQEGTLLPAYGSNDLYTDFFSHPAKRSLVHDDS